jgi:hypothetical protein
MVAWKLKKSSEFVLSSMDLDPTRKSQGLLLPIAATRPLFFFFIMFSHNDELITLA